VCVCVCVRVRVRVRVCVQLTTAAETSIRMHSNRNYSCAASSFWSENKNSLHSRGNFDDIFARNRQLRFGRTGKSNVNVKSSSTHHGTGLVIDGSVMPIRKWRHNMVDVLTDMWTCSLHCISCSMLKNKTPIRPQPARSNKYARMRDDDGGGTRCAEPGYVASGDTVIYIIMKLFAW
jgi:hypothetical protein